MATVLMKHEEQRILEALRHDIEHERELATREPEFAVVHLYNVRLNIQILESLNPKHFQ